MKLMNNSGLFRPALGHQNEREAAYQSPEDGYLRPLSSKNKLPQFRRWNFHKMEELSDYSRQLIATNSMDNLLDSITRRAVNLVQVTYCRILTLEPDGSFVCQAAYHSVPLAFRWLKGKTEPYLLNKIYEHALLSENPVIIKQSDKDLTNKERFGFELQYATSICLIPLRVETVPIGLMILGDEQALNDFQFTEDQLIMASVVANQAASAIDRARLSHRLEENRLETVLALAKAIEARDLYTGNHGSQMADYAEKVAKKLSCTGNEIQAIRWAALLHDIGKIGVPDNILLRPGPLTDEEWVNVRQHPKIGAEIVLKVSNLSQVAIYILSHHEHFDGSGYPKGLEGEAIPLGSRILAVIDAYSAITNGRSYRSARTHVEAIEELKRCSGSHFDPIVVNAFISLFNA